LGNPAKRKRTVHVLDSKNGRGVFAQRKIAKDEVVGQVRGDITSTDEHDPRYLMELDSDMLLRPKAPFRYLNHSCNPNCELFVWEDQKLDKKTGTRPLFVGALRSIRDGAELTIDYSWPAEFAIPCHCKSKNCRGWIVAEKQAKKLQKNKKGKKGKKKK